MDIYTRRTERENDYYVVMGRLEARLLTESGLSAARFLKTGRAKIEFKNELTGFTNNQLELLRGNYNSERKKLALQYLQQERKFLITQENLLRDKQATQYAAIEIKNDNGGIILCTKRYRDNRGFNSNYSWCKSNFHRERHGYWSCRRCSIATTWLECNFREYAFTI